MKKLLIIGFAALVLLALAACGGNGRCNNETNTEAITENLAGPWDLSSAGILIDIEADGTWLSSWGDISYRGIVQLAQDNGGGYTAEFIILEQSGPGAMYDSYGNIRQEAFNIETNEFYWMPFPSDQYSTWLFGTYYADNDRLIIKSLWGSSFEMEQEMQRIR
ncbi:MAG: hypothetical protein FWC67_01880 [Defluviitaleaceae bacterium]|nr:hypothetical protein [Defluviitaleaceae bacterium]